MCVCVHVHVWVCIACVHAYACCMLYEQDGLKVKLKSRNLSIESH